MSLSNSTVVTMIDNAVVKTKKTRNPKVPKVSLNETTVATVDTEVVVDTLKEKVVKPKVPTLSGKYAKFMQFGFWFANQVSDTDAREVLIKSLKIYDSVDVQTEFYKSFEDESKTVAKTLRANIVDAKKQVKLAEKAALKAEKKAAKMAEKPVKVPRAKKNKNIVDAPTDVISQIVALAQSTEPLVVSNEEPVTELQVTDSTTTTPTEKTKKGKKNIPEVSTDSLNVTTDKEKKPKRTYNKKPKNVESEKLPTQTSQHQDADDELDVDIIVIDGQQFLVDSDKNLYDFATHQPLNRKI